MVAVLPGTINPERRILISAHYDSVNRTGTPPGPPGPPPPVLDSNIDAPGVTDDGSGVACVMELARVMSHYEFEKTIVFLLFAGEEDGLVGSRLYAAKAKSLHQKIEAVLNNDIIGSEVGGNGRAENHRVNVYSEDPSASPSRAIARYVKEVGQRYLPSMTVDPVFRSDRFGRDGDHRPFNAEGFGAVSSIDAGGEFRQSAYRDGSARWNVAGVYRSRDASERRRGGCTGLGSEIAGDFGNDAARGAGNNFCASEPRQIRLRCPAPLETT